MSDHPVIVIGAGPVGLVTALTLATYGIATTLVDENEQETRWPKMDVTNCRSMEILRRLGLADGLRERGVPIQHSFDVLFSLGLSDGPNGQTLAKWDLPSPREARKLAQERNDGTLPREPYQRCSQTIFERWLREVCSKTPKIDFLTGHSFGSLLEDEDGITTTICSKGTGETSSIKSKFMIACDGARSPIRDAIEITLQGDPLPMKLYLVHFRSRDLSRLHSQGQFWHIFFVSGGVLISQDEIETFTAHLGLPADFDTSQLDPHELIYSVLGGAIEPYKIEVDEIIVSNTWYPKLAVADRYRSKEGAGRVFLAGDSAHQNVPTGGYGMNTGLADAYDISWKLAAILQGWGGKTLLDSYETERRPVAVRNVERSGVHMGVHLAAWGMVREAPREALFDEQDKEGLRRSIADHYLTHDGENKELGIELDYSFKDSPIVVCGDSDNADSRDWEPRKYHPSTLPGHRAPHVFLEQKPDTSIFDLCGSGFTLVDFAPAENTRKAFVKVAKNMDVPLTVVHLPDEPHVKGIWQRDLVLLRPDGFVAWSRVAGDDSISEDDIIAILERVTGR